MIGVKLSIQLDEATAYLSWNDGDYDIEMSLEAYRSLEKAIEYSSTYGPGYFGQFCFDLDDDIEEDIEEDNYSD